MDLGMSDRAKPLVEKVRDMVENKIIPLEAMQMYVGTGISQDTPLAAMFTNLRTLRFADGPDAVHRRQVARKELKQYSNETR